MLNSFDNDNLHAPLTEINITPLVDVLLVLLIVLMVCAPSIHSAIPLELPADQSQEFNNNNQSITISINQNGDYFLEEKLSDLKDLDNHLAEIAKQNNKQEIYLKADKNTVYSNITALLSILQKYNLTNISFITIPNHNLKKIVKRTVSSQICFNFC